jgi:hypothetical protein
MDLGMYQKKQSISMPQEKMACKHQNSTSAVSFTINNHYIVEYYQMYQLGSGIIIGLDIFWQRPLSLIFTILLERKVYLNS